VVEASDLPVMLYDVPGRTASLIELETYEAMRRYDHVVSVKEASGLLPRTAQLVDLGYSVYSGDDVATLGYLAYGGVGLVSVVAHAAGTQLASMIDAWVRGDHAEALRIHTSLLPAFDAVMGVPNYGATTAKAALELLGVLDNRRVRGPLVALDDDEVTALRAGLAAAGLL
jgi:4-hydroxy-tetrahydrodipicolinate synthase